MSPAPSDARYYAAQVFYGHSFWRMFHGSRQRIEAAIGLALGPYANVSAEHAAATAELVTASGGRGIRAVPGTALFIAPEQLSTYTQADTDEPILIEYREIPSRDHPPRRIRITFGPLQVQATGVGHCTGWTMSAVCKVNALPQTTIPLLGQVD